MRWGVFLDRDGTLVPNAHHPTRPDQLKLYRSTLPGLKLLRGSGARLLVASNQSVVARGMLSQAGLRAMDRHLKQLVRQGGTSLQGAYYCPHHPDFSRACACRKPKAGLLRQGLKEHRLKAAACYMVGDSKTDLQAGRVLGMKTVLVLTGYGRSVRSAALRNRLADHVASNVFGAAKWILRDRALTKA